MNELPITRVLIIALLNSVAAISLLPGAGNSAENELPDIRILDSGVYPESVTSAGDGSVYVGSIKGNVYRAEPGSATASAWIRGERSSCTRSGPI